MSWQYSDRTIPYSLYFLQTGIIIAFFHFSGIISEIQIFVKRPHRTPKPVCVDADYIFLADMLSTAEASFFFSLSNAIHISCLHMSGTIAILPSLLSFFDTFMSMGL